MLIKGIIEEDCVNYKQMCMYIAFPHCSFKCERECGFACCHNAELVNSENINISANALVSRYMHNNLTHALVCAGLEPFDDFDDLLDLIDIFRQHTLDDIVIYTGYTEDEVRDKVKQLKSYQNIIVKFGRFIPNSNNRYDGVLGVNLASENQYAIKIS